MNKKPERHGGPYRVRNGKVCGVCGGIAKHFALNPFWVRLGTVILGFITGFWPVIIVYFIAAMIMKPSPVHPIESDEEEEFYNAYTKVPDFTIRQVYDKFNSLDRRIQRMEDTVTNRAYEWDQKLNHS